MVGIHDRERAPRRTEKKKMCRRCGHRTTHLYDHGLKRFICANHEMNER